MEDDSFADKLMFSNEVAFSLSRNVNHHNVQLWSIENLCATVTVERNSTEVNVFSAVSWANVYGCFFSEKTVTGASCQGMMQFWMFLHLAAYSRDFVFQ